MQKATLTKALNIASKDILTDEAILNKGIFAMLLVTTTAAV